MYIDVYIIICNKLYQIDFTITQGLEQHCNLAFCPKQPLYIYMYLYILFKAELLDEFKIVSTHKALWMRSESISVIVFSFVCVID